MDPNEVLREMREIHASRCSREDFERFLELFTGLDTWLQRGGFLPRDWQRGIEVLVVDDPPLEHEKD